MLAQRAVGSFERVSVEILLAHGEPNGAATAGLLACASSLRSRSLNRSPHEQIGSKRPRISRGTFRGVAAPLASERDHVGSATGGATVDQRDLVSRAQRGDNDAFALLAGAAVAQLDSAARRRPI